MNPIVTSVPVETTARSFILIISFFNFVFSFLLYFVLFNIYSVSFYSCLIPVGQQYREWFPFSVGEIEAKVNRELLIVRSHNQTVLAL